MMFGDLDWIIVSSHSIHLSIYRLDDFDTRLSNFRINRWKARWSEKSEWDWRRRWRRRRRTHEIPSIVRVESNGAWWRIKTRSARDDDCLRSSKTSDDEEWIFDAVCWVVFLSLDKKATPWHSKIDENLENARAWMEGKKRSTKKKQLVGLR